MRDAIVRALMAEMERDPRIVLITGDLGFGVLRPVKERYPERLINAGIAEQSMVGLAAGLAAISPVEIIPYLFYPFCMGIAALVAILLQRQPSPTTCK